VRYSDEHVAVISKPAGVASQPGGAGECVNDHLAALEAFLSPSAPPGAEPLRVVHRLDRDTSGLLVLARTRAAAAALSDGLRRGALRKLYLGLSAPPAEAAVADGAAGTCTEPVTRSEWAPGGGGEPPSDVASWPAETDWAVRRHGALALWRLRPRTGRRHQLRQHVLHLQRGRGGLLGDAKYCGDKPGARAAALAAAGAEGGGLMLHACELVIPAGTLGAQQGADITVRDELPARVRAALRAHQVPARLLAEALA